MQLSDTAREHLHDLLPPRNTDTRMYHIRKTLQRKGLLPATDEYHDEAVAELAEESGDSSGPESPSPRARTEHAHSSCAYVFRHPTKG